MTSFSPPRTQHTKIHPLPSGVYAKYSDTICFVCTQLVSVAKDHQPTDRYHIYFSLIPDNKMRTSFVCFLLLISVLVMEAKSITMKKGKIIRGLRGENLNYNNCTNLLLRKSQNLLLLAPEVQWALKVYRVCSIHVSFKML